VYFAAHGCVPPLPQRRGSVRRFHAYHVHPGVDEPGDLLRFSGGGAERGDDLGAANQSRSLSVSAATSTGNTAPAGPRQVMWAAAEISVGSGLTSITTAPAPRATNGSCAAGCTSPDVPTTSIASQRVLHSHAAAVASWGSISPNHTTSGRTGAPQR